MRYRLNNWWQPVWAGLWCLVLLSGVAEAAPGTVPRQQVTLEDLLGLARTYVIDGLSPHESCGEDSANAAAQAGTADNTADADKTDAEDEDDGPRFSEDQAWIQARLDCMGFSDVWVPYTDVWEGHNAQTGSTSKDPDVRRIARFLDKTNPPFTYFNKYAGEINTAGREFVPRRWFMGLLIGGSGQFFQGQVMLSPLGLLSRQQVEQVTDALKKTGPFTPAGFSNEHGTRIERLLFDAATLQPLGASVIAVEEGQGQFALFLLLGAQDFFEQEEPAR